MISKSGVGGLLCLKPHSTIVQLHREENHRPPTSHKLYHIMLYRVHVAERDSNSQR